MKMVSWGCLPEAGPDGIAKAVEAAREQLKVDMGDLKFGVDYEIHFGNYPDDVDLVRGWVKAISLKR